MGMRGTQLLSMLFCGVCVAMCVCAASEAMQETFSLGPYTLFYRPTQYPFVIVQQGQRVVWQSPTNGDPFLFGGFAIANTDSAILNGNYNITEEVLLKTTGQSILQISKSDDSVTLLGTLTMSNDLIIAKYSLHFFLNDLSLLSFNTTITPSTDHTLNRLFFRYWCDPTESFHGFGHQYTYFNFKGLVLPIVVSEQGVGRGLQPLTSSLNQNNTYGPGGTWFTTYAPKPVYLTNHNRSIYIHNSQVQFFDLTSPDAVSIELWSLSLQGAIITGDTMCSVIQNITSLTGRMRPLPAWSQKGAIVGVEGGQEFVTQKVNALRQHNVALAGVWLQDWVGMRHSWDGDRLIWNWVLNPDQYPNWHKMVAEWAVHGTRVMNYINPFFADPTNLTSTPRRNMMQEGLQNGYFIRRKDGTPYGMWSLSFQFYMLDPTNPAAVRWIKQIIKEELLALPMSSGWMCDFGEYLPFDAVLFSGEDAASFHNKYPAAWAEITMSALQEAVVEGRIAASHEIVFFMRAGWTQSPANTSLFWLGDQLMSWDGDDGMQTVITGSLSSGLVGNSLQHSDIGGYNAVTNLGPDMYYTRSYEMLKRWSELSAFGAAAFRTHPGNQYLTTAQVYDNDDIMNHFATFSGIFGNLSAYRLSLMEEAQQFGYPLVRPLAMHYAYDPVVWSLVSEYLFGEDFLVAPVLEAGAVVKDVYFPKGAQQWVDLWSGEVVAVDKNGQWTQVNAPLGQPPVFYKLGSVYGVELRAYLLSLSAQE